MAAEDWFGKLLAKELAGVGSLSHEQVTQLWEHYQRLLLWNQRLSLTSIEPGKEMVVRHYCESLYFAAQLPGSAGSIADIGSGAGFPGIPMAIWNPNWTVTLVESNQKKGVFLREASRGLSNIRVESKRAQDLSGEFDWIVSRAVDPSEVVALVPRLSRKIGLMIGEDDFLTLPAGKHIAWSEPVRLPWGDHRVCAFGVSRGTSEP